MKKHHLLLFLILASATGILSACKKDIQQEPNKPPIANAGHDTIMTFPIDSLVLDGTRSYDSDGRISEYLWTRISGPSSITINNPKSSKTAVKNVTNGIYRFELKIKDNLGLSGRDTLTFTVDSLLTVNHPPVADAGLDRTLTLPKNYDTLDAGLSFDEDNNITHYDWTKISGPPSGLILNPNGKQTQVETLEKGTYEIELVVRDAFGLSDRDTIQIFVRESATDSACNNRKLISATLIQIGSLSVGRSRMMVGAAGNRILFAGGDSSTMYGGSVQCTRVDILDFTTNTWSTTELPRTMELEGITVASVGNKVLFAGGRGSWDIDYSTAETTSRVDIYDASKNIWSTAELSVARSDIAAVTLGNKVFFAGGGHTDGNTITWTYSDVVDIYDESTNTWTTAKLSESRSNFSATVAGNKIYFAGGLNNPFINLSKTIDVYNAGTNSWSVEQMSVGRAYHSGISAGDKIFWAGGNDSFENGWNLSTTAEIRDISTGVTSSACMIPRHMPGVVTKGDKIIFFTGFATGGLNGTQFEIYDISNNTWSNVELNVRVVGASIISVNNTIYVAGGSFNGEPPYYRQVWKLEF